MDILPEFSDDDDEIVDFVENLRTYTVRERKNYFEEYSDMEFYNRFRFGKRTVENMFLQIQHLLTGNGNNPRYHEVEPISQLLLALRFYACGDFYISIGDFGGIFKTTAGRIIKKVTEAILTLRPMYINFPNTEEGPLNIQRNFHKIAGFPRVIGVIGCSHIRIQSPGREHGEVFRNRKGYFSLNVQVVCDSNHKILDIVARWPGSCHDSHIFQNSFINRRFEAGEFGNGILIGDSAYPLKNFLMTPLANPVTEAEQRYNRALITTRIIIEKTFGIWKRKFAILSRGIRCAVPLMQQIITATAVLHNIAILNNEEEALLDDIVEQNDDFLELDGVAAVAVHNFNHV